MRVLLVAYNTHSLYEVKVNKIDASGIEGEYRSTSVRDGEKDLANQTWYGPGLFLWGRIYTMQNLDIRE